MHKFFILWERYLLLGSCLFGGSLSGGLCGCLGWFSSGLSRLLSYGLGGGLLGNWLGGLSCGLLGDWLCGLGGLNSLSSSLLGGCLLDWLLGTLGRGSTLLGVLGGLGLSSLGISLLRSTTSSLNNGLALGTLSLLTIADEFSVCLSLELVLGLALLLEQSLPLPGIDLTFSDQTLDLGDLHELLGNTSLGGELGNLLESVFGNVVLLG